MDIVLVEDNQELANLIKAFLQKEGFSLWHETSAERALFWLCEHSAKLILLDIMLPGMDGFAFCQEIRRMQNVPILILSARSSKRDQLMGFELGADDYMEKPIDTDLLTARIRVLLARAYGNQEKNNYLTSGQIHIDTIARKVSLDTKQIELNIKEYELLLCFVQNVGKTLRKEYLFNQIWGCESESEYQTLTVHVKMLRDKIENDPKHPKRIQTVWGIGYRYEEL